MQVDSGELMSIVDNLRQAQSTDDDYQTQLTHMLSLFSMCTDVRLICVDDLLTYV